MGSDEKTRPRSSKYANKAQGQIIRADQFTGVSSEQLLSASVPERRCSIESTATTLPPYSEQSDRPPAYADSRQPSTAGNSKSRSQQVNASQLPDGPNAAAVRAMMAPSSSKTDKMHTRPSRVIDWDDNPTYKRRLETMEGQSTGKWNYWGSDLDKYGNPFKDMFGRKKK